MNENGTAGDMAVHLAQPGPLNEPKTFCAPCAMKMTPNARRNGTVIQVEEVEISLRSMTLTFRFGFYVERETTISPFAPVRLATSPEVSSGSVSARARSASLCRKGILIGGKLERAAPAADRMSALTAAPGTDLIPAARNGTKLSDCVPTHYS